MTRYLIPTLLFTALATAQPPAKAPEVPAPLVTKLFKAQAELANAQLAAQRAGQALDQKNAVMQEIVGELRNACGPSHEPKINDAGDPVCVAKPEPAKK